MPTTYICERCGKNFKQKSHLDAHTKRKRPCKKDDTLTKLVEAKVEEKVEKKVEEKVNELLNVRTMQTNQPDYSEKTREELIVICKEKNIKGYSGKKREVILQLVNNFTTSQKQDTGKFRTNMKEQFYTNKKVAKDCIQRITSLLPFTSDYIWIEPSAGNGAFLHNIPSSYKKFGFDVEPKADDIIKQDYLKWSPPNDKDIVIFGNPPFGRQSSLAKSFISKSCKFAKVIALILPKSFTKPSMYNVFDLQFHLIYSEELEKDSFILNGSNYHVPCVFQIWQKKDTNRMIEKKVIPVGFEYVKSSEIYHLAFRRVGGLAGKCYKNDGSAFSIQSHYFIKFNKNIVCYKDSVMEKINNHVFPSNTLGPRSLSKSEANKVINDIIQSVSS